MEQYECDKERLQILWRTLHPECEQLAEISKQTQSENIIKDLDRALQVHQLEVNSIEQQIKDLLEKKRLLTGKLGVTRRNLYHARSKYKQGVAAKESLAAITACFDRAQQSMEVIDLEMQDQYKLQEAKWESWDEYAVVSWICRLDGGKFSKYKGFWRESFEQEKVTGDQLP